MAVDSKVPQGNPGIASFASESWGNEPHPFLSDTPPPVTQTVSITASGADIEITYLDVLNGAGALADYNATPDAGTADYIAAATITVPDGETKEVPVYRAGHFDMDALTWDSSYDTDAKKKAAFEGSASPTIFIGKNPHSSDDIY